MELYGVDILSEKVNRIFLSDDEQDYTFDNERLQFLYTPDAMERLAKEGVSRE